MDTPLKQAREKRNLSVAELCKKLRVHPQNFYRIERGQQSPKRPLGRRIHKFFKGEVSLGDIYDPEYSRKVRRSKRR